VEDAAFWTLRGDHKKGWGSGGDGAADWKRRGNFSGRTVGPIGMDSIIGRERSDHDEVKIKKNLERGTCMEGGRGHNRENKKGIDRVGKKLVGGRGCIFGFSLIGEPDDRSLASKGKGVKETYRVSDIQGTSEGKRILCLKRLSERLHSLPGGV